MKAGRYFLALLFFVGAAGAFISAAPIFSRFVYSSLLLSAIAFLWPYWSIRQIRIERIARARRANMGDVFEETFKLTNQGRIPLVWLEVKNNSPLPLAAGSRLFTLVQAKQTRTYTARTWLTRRGSFKLGPTILKTGDPFGLFTTSRVVHTHNNLIVFPFIHELHSFSLPQGMLAGGQVIRKKANDITPHAAGVREYAYGDAMKRIHWPLSAKRGSLMVKEFEQDPQSDIWLLLDLHKNTHYQKDHTEPELQMHDLFLKKKPKLELPPSTLEYSVSIAATLAHHFLQNRRTVGLASAGQTFNIIPAERGERQEAKILEMLSFVKSDGSLSLAGLVTSQAALLPSGSNVILITPSTRPDLLIAVDELQRHFVSPFVILLDAQTFNGPSGTQELFIALQERSVPCLLISCGADLSQTLSFDTTHLTLQELIT